MNENIILKSIVERLQRYSAKYFHGEKYTITNAIWDKSNNQAVITLDRTINPFQGQKQKIVIEDIPYKWSVESLSIHLQTRNILLETTTKTVLHGSLFAYNNIHLQGVEINKPIYDLNDNIIGYEPYIEATEYVNQTYKISLVNLYSNTIIALDNQSYQRRDTLINLIHYKSFDGIDNLQFDFTNANILFYPKESQDLHRINKIYNKNEYTIDGTDAKILYLPLSEEYCNDEFFDDILANNSYLYSTPQIEVGDITAFYQYAQNQISLQTPRPFAFARISYNGFSQRVPVQSIDDTTATSLIANVKQEYNINIGIVLQTYRQEQVAEINAQNKIVEALKINIHNNLVQVLQDFNVELGFDDLTFSNKSNAQINFDADFSTWEWTSGENKPMYITQMIIQTVYDGKKIARLENMLIKQPTAVELHTATYARNVETPQKKIIN